MTAASSWLMYNLAWHLENPALHHFLAMVCGTMMFISITFGPLLIYPWTYARGASPKERVFACLVTPFLWATKECIRLSISFTFLECLYYYVNPLSIWLACGLVAQMGLTELIVRWRQKRRGRSVKVLHPYPLAATIGGLFLVVFLYAWGSGENVYVMFLDGYRKLFGSGL